MISPGRVPQRTRFGLAVVRRVRGFKPLLTSQNASKHVPERDTRDTTHIAQDALVRAISICAFLVECPSVPASGLPSPVVSAVFSMFSLSFSDKVMVY